MSEFADDPTDYIYYLYADAWSDVRIFYCADCAPADANRFSPEMEVQENGALPPITCETCGCELTPEKVTG